jgi:erythromycin esterase-like protein
MNLSKWLIGISTAVAFSVMVTTTQAARIKCWTNDEGVRECGSSVPPKYAQKGHREITSGGLTVKKQVGAISQEEKDKRAAARTAARAEKLEKERLRNIEAARHRQQVAKDRVLLDTFVSEEDVELAHKRKVAAIESHIEHRTTHIGKLEDTLGTHQRAAANQERSGKQVADRTKKSIEQVQIQIEEGEQFIASSEDEVKRLEAEYHAELTRFRFLKTGGKVGSRVDP